MNRQILHDAISELIELLQSIDVDKLPEYAIIPLARTIYQLCGAIIAAKQFDN